MTPPLSPSFPTSPTPTSPTSSPFSTTKLSHILECINDQCVFNPRFNTITSLIEFAESNPTLITEGKCNKNIFIKYFDASSIQPNVDAEITSYIKKSHPSRHVILTAIKDTNIPKLLQLLNPSSHPIVAKLYEFTQMQNPSPKQFKQIISDHIIRRFPNIELFGSIIYNFDGANDIDIYGSRRDVSDMLQFLRIFFDVATTKKTETQTETQTKTQTETQTKTQNPHTYSHDVNTFTISLGSLFLTKIDFVDESLKHKDPDFIECSLTRSNTALYFRHTTPLLDWASAIKNLSNKQLTPANLKIRNLSDIKQMLRTWERATRRLRDGFTIIAPLPHDDCIAWYEHNHYINQHPELAKDIIILIIKYQGTRVYNNDTELCEICKTQLNHKLDPQLPFMIRICSTSLICHPQCFLTHVNNAKPISESSSNNFKIKKFGPLIDPFME